MALSNAERQARYRAKQPKVATQTCQICGGWIWGKVTPLIGFHQKCDLSAYRKKYRELKSKREMSNGA